MEDMKPTIILLLANKNGRFDVHCR